MVLASNKWFTTEELIQITSLTRGQVDQLRKNNVITSVKGIAYRYNYYNLLLAFLIAKCSPYVNNSRNMKKAYKALTEEQLLTHTLLFVSYESLTIQSFKAYTDRFNFIVNDEQKISNNAVISFDSENEIQKQSQFNKYETIHKTDSFQLDIEDDNFKVISRLNFTDVVVVHLERLKKDLEEKARELNIENLSKKLAG